MFLLGVRNRLSVILGWVWSYFTFDVGVPVDYRRGDSTVITEPYRRALIAAQSAIPMVHGASRGDWPINAA
jgi:hypothetical protein